MSMAADVDTIERTSIVAYTLLNELHDVLALPKAPDDVTLGILMGLSMFMDDKVGPMRSKRLMSEAPTIVLKTDAHVTSDQMQRIMPVLRAFGDHLKDMRAKAARPVDDTVA
ncbi:hypothetical protein Sp245p_07125 [Azospirillum baldaniorum]|uniref:Uncharacterized protein n=5 Tax=Azospirillum TaxID=191 RepID=A0A4D8Q681_AZOBR|nr:hypothetical protein ABAZ39_05060 [Azospirillum argentinense]AWJ89568.1 hypothetical protein Sp245p_07125 [Azospirillum baldaniorum]QCO14181.1 hypothetical protein D3869_02445 [Azospirillum brasilense]EZQ08315.1 hypothetical protein ABAZ39_06500 [Azospirillum argentinense]KAA1058705.1 hypothetical protein FH063_000905 [Azospirillum argentinense]